MLLKLIKKKEPPELGKHAYTLVAEENTVANTEFMILNTVVFSFCKLKISLKGTACNIKKGR